ncbi:MAG: hypothetical protein CVV49_07855 [Spirochaetae bacterium HGW-Spirochaetae-5]|nr:MAG: hypothetical protein CVV49_07855 [Spirochaetae bacterium HGW-Spirochaetae-5]
MCRVANNIIFLTFTLLIIFYIGCFKSDKDEEEKEMINAIKQNNIEFLTKKLRNGFDLNNQKLMEEIPLHLAVSESKINIIYLFLENKANVNARDEILGNTCLWYAVDVEVVKLLIEKGIDINLQNKRGEIALFHFVYDDYHDNYKISNLLIENGSNLNTRDRVGATPISIAVYGGNYKSFDLLLKKGAEINIKDNNNFNLLNYLALGKSSVKFARILEKNGITFDNITKNGDNSIILVAKHPIEKVEYLKFLLSKGLNINHQNIFGNTALHEAVESGSSEIVAELLKNRAKINIKNKEGKTAEAIAIHNKDNKIIKLFKLAHTRQL